MLHFKIHLFVVTFKTTLLSSDNILSTDSFLLFFAALVRQFVSHNGFCFLNVSSKIIFTSKVTLQYDLFLQESEAIE